MARRRGRRSRPPLLIVGSHRATFMIALFMASMFTAGIVGGVALPAASTGPLSGQVVYIDPGHGGIDPGACGRDVVEKDVVLNVALYLGVRLEKSGARVVYSRTGDYDLDADGKDDAEERIKIIESSGATVVISLHCNAFPDPSEWGAQTFYNSSKNPESRRLALLVQDELVKATESPREASARLDHFILSHSAVPSVTVEMGFLSNPREEGLLGSHAYQQKIAECIRRAVVSFVSGSV
ncbi:MAG: N-acetylmuramoyl-L-alanine amidase [Bacillota bacterium]